MISAETYKEIKDALKDFAKIFMLCAAGLGLFIGAAYVYFTCIK